MAMDLDIYYYSPAAREGDPMVRRKVEPREYNTLWVSPIAPGSSGALQLQDGEFAEGYDYPGIIGDFYIDFWVKFEVNPSG